MTAEFDQLVAEFEAFQAQLRNVDDRFEQLSGMREELAGLEAVATSADRSVTVIAGPGGAVKDVRLTDAALALGPQRLGGMIMSTLNEAVADAARQQAGIVQEYAGDDAPVLDQVLETQAEVTGTPVEELREKVRPSRPAPAEDDDTVFQDSAPVRHHADTDTDADSFLRNLSDDEED